MTRYEDDRAQWSDEQIDALRSRDWAALDVPMLVRLLNGQTPEHVERHLRKLLAALLKWMVCPSRRNARWSEIIRRHRYFLKSIFEDDPPMRDHAVAELQAEYELAVSRAAPAVGVEPQDLPARCPWTLGQTIDSEFMPGVPATPDDYNRAYGEIGQYRRGRLSDSASPATDGPVVLCVTIAKQPETTCQTRACRLMQKRLSIAR